MTRPVANLRRLSALLALGQREGSHGWGTTWRDRIGGGKKEKIPESSLAGGGVISKGFVDLILLTIVGNAVGHVTAVVASVEDKFTLSVGATLGSGTVSSLPPPQLRCR